ncbi:hypothetical protein VNO78_22816 [Psophocarpus tetragonolobus]|uniref:Uncharacterized protein n=1 Tax=Psophocarpus tetragonolobus TaxID=3891 RepID=A0AAN9S3T1_PSOTE
MSVIHPWSWTILANNIHSAFCSLHHLPKIGRVFLAAIRNRSSNLHQSSGKFSFLDKAWLRIEEEGSCCSLSEVEEAKGMLRLGPIWATCLVYTIAFAQVPTFFTKQGVNMDRTIFPGFDIL